MAGLAHEKTCRGGLAVLLALVLSTAAAGCLVAVGAAVGAGVVVASGEDGAEIQFDEEEKDVVWDATYAVTDEWGVVTIVDRERGFLEAKEGETTVTVSVWSVGDRGVKVRFKARKLGSTIPDRHRAEMLAHALSDRLARSS